MLIDVVKEGTDLVVVSDDHSVVEETFDTKLDGDRFHVDYQDDES